MYQTCTKHVPNMYHSQSVRRVYPNLSNGVLLGFIQNEISHSKLYFFRKPEQHSVAQRHWFECVMLLGFWEFFKINNNNKIKIRLTLTDSDRVCEDPWHFKFKLWVTFKIIFLGGTVQVLNQLIMVTKTNDISIRLRRLKSHLKIDLESP